MLVKHGRQPCRTNTVPTQPLSSRTMLVTTSPERSFSKRRAFRGRVLVCARACGCGGLECDSLGAARPYVCV
eukprot:6199735-Pleurochrysis_carterae.AAC.2